MPSWSCEHCNVTFKEIRYLRKHLKNSHGVKLRDKMSNKVFSLNCQSVIDTHLSLKKSGIADKDIFAVLKNRYTEIVVADVKRELSTFKSKCTEQIDKQQFTLESLPDFPLENESMLEVVHWVEHMKLEDFDKFQIFVNHLLERKKLRQLELDENFLKVKEVLVTMGAASDREILVNNVERALLKRLMQENEHLKAKIAASSSENSESSSSASSASSSAASASSPPGESTSFIGLMSDTLLGKRKDV